MRREDFERRLGMWQRVWASTFLAVALYGAIRTATDEQWLLMAVFAVISVAMVVLVIRGIRKSSAE